MIVLPAASLHLIGGLGLAYAKKLLFNLNSCTMLKMSAHSAFTLHGNVSRPVCLLDSKLWNSFGEKLSVGTRNSHEVSKKSPMEILS